MPKNINVNDRVVGKTKSWDGMIGIVCHIEERVDKKKKQVFYNVLWKGADAPIKLHTLNIKKDDEEYKPSINPLSRKDRPDGVLAFYVDKKRQREM
jgi:hypothetical protein